MVEKFSIFDTVEVKFKQSTIPGICKVFLYIEKQKGFFLSSRLDIETNIYDAFYLGTSKSADYVKLSQIYNVCTCRMVLFEKYDKEMIDSFYLNFHIS